MASDKPATVIGREWWRALPLPALGSGFRHLDELGPLYALARRALDGGPPVTELDVREGLSDHLLDDLRAALRELGLRCVHRSARLDGTCLAETFASESGFIQVDVRPSRTIELNAVLQGDDFVRRTREALLALVKPAPKESGRVYLLTARSDRPMFTRVGCAGVELARLNYSPDTLDAFDHAVADIGSPSPCGRLVLLEGPPGTGKSFLLRGMMFALERAEFLVIPPHLLPSMAGPSLVHALLSFADELTDGHQGVLVLEDADECLVPRQADNVAAIATLLDFTDGLFSALTDIRVVASTNAKHVEIDPAAVRPGRLCRHIHIGLLDSVRANEVLRGLTDEPGAPPFDGPVSLAEVYQVARRVGWKPAAAVPERVAP